MMFVRACITGNLIDDRNSLFAIWLMGIRHRENTFFGSEYPDTVPQLRRKTDLINDENALACPEKKLTI